MQNVIKRFFTKDFTFTLCTWVAVLANMIMSIFSFFPQSEGLVDFSYLVQCIVEGVCLFFIYTSYKKHQKNMTKGLLGFLLAINLLNTIEFSQLLDGTVLDYFMEGITLIVTVILTVNHFVINRTHKSSPMNVYINQISAGVLILISGIVWSVLGLLQNPNGVVAFTNIMSLFGYSGKIAAIVCVESRLDAYRLDREAAGWTEEKGYPEGYVHEYEKKK